ncbi:MAG: hypothetical protein H0U98_06555 [Alphaproteobacteria bacterium]|nr:hypothetical protein [Alphaproteobacteria bacterium]
MLKKIATGAGLLAALAVSGVVLAALAMPQPAAKPQTGVNSARLAEGKPFAPICKTGEVVDSRPDPAWVGQSFARDNCTAPQMPAAVNGLVASREEIVAGMAATKRYAALSDAYQRCIRDFVTVRQSRSDAGKPAAMALATIENHRILVSETNKNKARARMDASIMAFNEYGSGCPDQ